MTSPRQLIANRANAKLSTGPRTPEGKEASRRNAVINGYRASTVLLEGEDEETLKTLRVAVAEELAPEGVVEFELADRFAGLLWRCRRMAVFEAALFTWLGHWSEEYYDLPRNEKGWNDQQERMQKFHQGLKPEGKDRSEARQQRLALGRLLNEGMNQNLMAKLSRYETHLLNQLRRTYLQLRDMQERRERKEDRQWARPERSSWRDIEPSKHL